MDIPFHGRKIQCAVSLINSFSENFKIKPEGPLVFEMLDKWQRAVLSFVVGSTSLGSRISMAENPGKADNPNRTENCPNLNISKLR